MSDKEMVRVYAEVPKRSKKIAKRKLEHGGLTREIRECIERIAHGAEVSEKQRLKDDLEEMRDERQGLKQERSRIDDDLDALERKIERAENKLDQLRDKEGEYEGALRMIEESMHEDGMCVFEGHGQVQEAAELGNCSQDDVVNDLKNRNPTLPDSRFNEQL